MHSVVDGQLTEVAKEPTSSEPKMNPVTPCSIEKLVPLNVIGVPPASGPLVGLIAVNVGIAR